MTGHDHLADPYETAPGRPLLLVDVDGVLSLFGFDAGSPPEGRMALVDGLPHLLAPPTADRLRALARTQTRGSSRRPCPHLPVRLVHRRGGAPRRAPAAPARPAPGLAPCAAAG